MLSARGTKWSKIGFLHGNQNTYHPTTNPNGIVYLTNAFNWFVHKDLAQFFNTHNEFDEELCTYGEGYTGTLRLRIAMAKHLNAHFHPIEAIDPEEITFAAGVTDLNEVCAMVTSDPGDYIMLGRPIYGPFGKDLVLRTGVNLEYVSVGDTDQFTPACATAYEASFNDANAQGRNIKALVICNPHNPLGQCYPPETLKALLRFCSAKKIHLISDEIYALSVYDFEDRPSEKFTSIRAIDTTGIIDPRQVHVLYGMSKDYGAAGLRLGCVVSQNTKFSNAARAICRFSSPSQFSMDLAAKFLEDQDFMDKLLQKSRRELLRSRLLTEELLQAAEIRFHQKGNAGLFLWIDLSPYLPVEETHDDKWAAERLLTKRLEQAGVIMDFGEEYRATRAGQFRLMFTVEQSTLREGIKRLTAVLSQQH